MSLLVAQVSDAHIGSAHGAPADVLRGALVYLAALNPQPDVVLLTGDLTDTGSPEEYATLRDVVATWRGAPLLMLPGNHDERSGFARLLEQEQARLLERAGDPRFLERAGDPRFLERAGDPRFLERAGDPRFLERAGDPRFLERAGDSRFLERAQRVERPLDHAAVVSGVLFCMLDSLVQAADGTRATHGALQPESLDWLDATLAAREPGQRAVVCVHHPPIDLGHSVMDPIRLLEPEGLADVLGRHEGVVGVLTGHAHTMAAAEFAGLPLRIGGSLCGTMVLDAEPGRMVYELPPSFAFHTIGDDGSLLTQWRMLPVCA